MEGAEWDVFWRMKGRGGVGRGGGVGYGYGRGKGCFCLVKTQKKAWSKTRRPVVSMVCLILLFNKGVPLPSLMIAGKVARRLHTVGEVRRQTWNKVCLWLRAV